MGPDYPIPLSLIIVQRFDWQAFDCVHEEQQNDDFNRPADDFLWKSLSQKAIQGTCRFGLEVHHIVLKNTFEIRIWKKVYVARRCQVIS